MILNYILHNYIYIYDYNNILYNYMLYNYIYIFHSYIYIYTGWWWALPLWKMMEFISWDDEIPSIWNNKSHVPNHQPVYMCI